MRRNTKPKITPHRVDGDAATDNPAVYDSGRRPKERPAPDFYSVADVAAKLACSVKSVRRRIDAGILRATREGGRVLVARVDYHDYIVRLT